MRKGNVEYIIAEPRDQEQKVGSQTFPAISEKVCIYCVMTETHILCKPAY